MDQMTILTSFLKINKDLALSILKMNVQYKTVKLNSKMKILKKEW